jgi:paraquat-inducible protein B
MSEEISLVKGTIEIDSSKSVEATNAVVGALKEMAEQAGQTKRAISDVFKTLNNAGNRKGITGYAESMEKALEGVGETAKDAQDQIRTLNDFMKTTSKGGKFLKSKEELADVIAGSLMPQAKGFAKKEDRSGFGRTANTLA